MTASVASADAPPETRRRPALSVVVPVYNGGEEIVANVGVIHRAVTEGLPGEEIELIVVSDGSIDGTDERLLAARSDLGVRVIHYDRNLGKGYAVRTGALASGGDWIAIIDADLDLDPHTIPGYLAAARKENLDFAIGSKRHPDSVVHYPRSRRAASWCYQQLNRVLFGLDVQDTQVGLKVFRREVAEDVLPLLLVKAFAFDLELLAVANALGHRRVAELPVRLDYRFTGSEVRSRAVVRALWDTAAVFYRLRLLRTYQRKWSLLAGSVASQEAPLVTVVSSSDVAAAIDYPNLDPVGDLGDPERIRGELVGVVAPGARPAGNWLSAAIPYFANPDVAAVVAPALAPPDSTLRELGGAAVLESRLGGGSRRSRHFPGNVRVIDDFPSETLVIRREDLLAARRADAAEQIVEWLAERGRRTVYSPDTMVSFAPPPLFAPHLRASFRHAVARGAAARTTRGTSLSSATLLSLLPAAAAAGGTVLAVAESDTKRTVGLTLVGAYAGLITMSAVLAAARFRSLTVGALAVPGLIATQAAYVAGFTRGFTRRR